LSRHNIERGLSIIFKGTIDINIVAQERDLSDAILREGSDQNQRFDIYLDVLIFRDDCFQLFK
jgi:hypothetical protein